MTPEKNVARNDTTADQVRTTVRDHYGRIARTGGSCAPGCCGPGTAEQARALGYADDDLAGGPEDANLGLGCGNPGAIASLQAGEAVLDLGSGAGFDCFLAARAVGRAGRVVGVDMTAEMVERARSHARELGLENVEFRLGEIEHLPVPDRSIDVILSNCVVNLSPDKRAVFREAFRVLRPGGRLAISDVVAVGEIPAELADPRSLAGCIAGAAPLEDVRAMLEEAGFEEVRVTIAPRSAEIVDGWTAGASEVVASARLEGRRPEAARSCCGADCCR